MIEEEDYADECYIYIYECESDYGNPVLMQRVFARKEAYSASHGLLEIDAYQLLENRLLRD
jgi:hypothetical protein